MLRRFTTLARVLRSRVPGARERLTYRMLEALVVKPERRVVRASVPARAAPRGEKPRYTP
jgi:hypothetical protein